MTTEQEAIQELDWRILNLEYERLKELHAARSILITEPPRGKDEGRQMRSTRMASGQMRHEVRTETGWKVLSDNRTTWPKWARKAIEGFERIDKARTVNNRIVSNSRISD